MRRRQDVSARRTASTQGVSFDLLFFSVERAGDLGACGGAARPCCSRCCALRAHALAAAIFDALIVLFSLVFLYVAWRERALCLAQAMRVPLVAMLVASAFMPEWISGSWAAQIRLPVAATFVAIASLTPRLPRRDTLPLFGVAALALLGARSAGHTARRADIDRAICDA